MSTRLGETKENSLGTLMKIIRYESSTDIDVEFLDDFHCVKEHQVYVNFKRGAIKNPYDKSVYGIGYIGEGQYGVSKKDPRLIARYSAWRNLLGRVYCEKTGHRHIPYIGCEVCEEWHNYQNFSEWYETHMYQVGTERMHIDKNILHEGNKIYSPENCIIVPQSINEIFHTSLRKTKDLDLPYTIRRTDSNRYSVLYRGHSVGVYDTVEDAENAYLRAKREYIKNKVNEFKDELPKYIQEILLNW